MDNAKKKIIILTILGVLIVTVGITYAITINAGISSQNEQLVTGDIYMHYNETTALTIQNAVSRNAYDPTKYFEFTIDGKNTTTNHDIYYDIQLIRGDVPSGKLEANRIADRFIKFRFVSVSNNVETEIFNNKNYSDLSASQRIHVATIPRNTTSEITHTYRLYMWIDSDISLGTGYDYTYAEWNNLFASIRVNVTGDFDYKEVATNPECFDTRLIKMGNYNSNMTSGELAECISYFSNKSFGSGENATDFCNGTGTRYTETFQDSLNSLRFSDSEFDDLQSMNAITNVESVVSITDYDASCGSDVVIPTRMAAQGLNDLANPNNSTALNACISRLTTIFGNEEYVVYPGESYDSFCKGTGTLKEYSFGEMMINGQFSNSDINYFKENQIWTLGTTNYYVRHIGSNYKYGDAAGAFFSKNLTSAVISSSVRNIGGTAFAYNQLTSVTIPNSVIEIDTEAFKDNQLTSLSISNSITHIGYHAFQSNPITSLYIDMTNFEDGQNFLKEIGLVLNNSISGYDITFGEHTRTIGCLGCGADKSYINSLTISNGVTTLLYRAFYQSLKDSITTINIPNSVTSIGEEAFALNSLTSINIPNTVTSIGTRAFNSNKLNTVTIGNGVTSIGNAAFHNKEGYNISSITINKSCSDIKNNLLFSGNNYYPWLESNSPYTSSGTTIYGSNNTVCDTF